MNDYDSKDLVSFYIKISSLGLRLNTFLVCNSEDWIIIQLECVSMGTLDILGIHPKSHHLLHASIFLDNINRGEVASWSLIICERNYTLTIHASYW